jgi:HK97 family phage prohead protease
MEKEIKSLTIEFKAKEEGMIEGYAAYFNNVDSYDDIIVPGAFQKTIKENMQDIKMVWNHDWDDVPIGNIIELKEDEKGLYFMAKLNNTTLAQDIKEAIKTGAVNKMSIGYKCTQYENKETDGKWIRHIKEVKLYEISPVNFPANDMATINSYKSKELEMIKKIIREEFKKANATTRTLKINSNKDATWDSSAAETRVREFADGDWGLYSKAFLWFDENNIELLGSYKLQVADVISGELQIIWKAVTSAMAALNGARGGVNISDVDKEKVYAVIKSLYAKFDETAPELAKNNNFDEVMLKINNLIKKTGGK